MQHGAKRDAGAFVYCSDRSRDSSGGSLSGNGYKGTAEGQFRNKRTKSSRPIEEKESFRWLNALNETRQRVPEDIPILTVCDREGDFYGFFSEASDLGADFLVRMVDDGKKIFNELRGSPVAGSMVVRMSRNPKEHIPSRNVKMDYHCKEVVIYRPQRRRDEHLREKLELTAIYVHESGKKGIEWFLLTTVKIKNEKDREKLIQCYTHRWKIERFHFILKSGCKIEKNQAREYGRLTFLTLLYSVIAMQMLNLTYLGKLCPEISSEIVLDKEEWKVLYCCARNTKEIPKTYTLKEAIYDLGILGGRKGAPSDGMPGALSIWQGLEVLCSLLAYRQYIV